MFFVCVCVCLSAGMFAGFIDIGIGLHSEYIVVRSTPRQLILNPPLLLFEE